VATGIRGSNVLGRSVRIRDASKWLNKGIGLLARSEFEEALKCFDEAIKIHPEYAVAWLNRGFALRGLGRFEEVLECYKRATEIDPGYIEAWLNRGFALRGLGRFEEALDCFDKVIKKDPANTEAWAGKGFVFDKLNRVAETVTCYDEALRLNPSHGWAKERRKALENEFGTRLPKRALQLNENAVGWYDKGNTLAVLGRFEDAIKCYDEAIRIEPSYAASWYSKGIALSELGIFEEAVRCYDEVIRIDPSFKMAVEEKKLAEKKSEKKLPRLTTTLLETIFKPNLWKQTSLVMRNTSEAPMKNIKIEFLKRVEIGGLKEVENLEPGEEHKLIFSLKPLESGEVPVEVRITCKDGEGREYAGSEVIMLEVVKGGLKGFSASTTQQAQKIELSLQPRITVDKCIICNLTLKRGDEVVRCPSCGNKAHKTHMLEWLHVKKYCPACHKLV